MIKYPFKTFLLSSDSDTTQDYRHPLLSQFVDYDGIHHNQQIDSDDGGTKKT